MIAGGVLLAEYGHVMVRAIHRGAHQVCGARIAADEVLVGFLLVQHGRHKRSDRTGHIAAEFRENARLQIGSGEGSLIRLVYLIAYELDVGLRILRTVRDAHAAGKIDKADLDAQLVMQFLRGFKEELCKRRIIHVIRVIGRKERVQAKFRYAQLLEFLHALCELCAREAIFRIRRVAHDLRADLEFAARVKAAADSLRDAAVLCKEVDMRNIVKVDDGVKPARIFKILCRRCVGGKHDVVRHDAHGFAEHQLRIAGAVHAAALFFEDLHQHGVRAGLYRIILLIALVPGKRLLQRAHAGAQAMLIVNVEGRGIFLDDGFDLCFVVG